MRGLYVLVTFLLLFHQFNAAKLEFSFDILHEIDSFLSPNEVFKLRLVNRAMKKQAEEYAERNIVKRKQFGLIRDWQLLLLKTGNFGLKEQIYSPIKCKNHIKLLKFVANYPEFRGLYCELRADVSGFLKPMIEYYGKKIHGLSKFVKIFDCEYLTERNEKNYYNFDYSDFEPLLLIISGLECMQG